MKRILLATTALGVAGVLAAGPASAADMLAVGVGGYMEQWVGYANRDDPGVDGGFDIQSDSEIYFSGSMESDTGLKFGVNVQLEANQNTNIDESFAYMSGAFGRLEIGARDPIHARTHYAAAFGAGVGLNAGDTQKWIGGTYLETAGWLHDNLNVIYISPRTNGVQVGVSYGADAGSESSSASAPDNNDDAVWAAGINFVETVGEMAFAISLGHLNRSQSASSSATGTDSTGTELTIATGNDDLTFTNAGLQIGMGAFTFGASFAARDNGTYMPECYVTAAFDHDDDANTADAPADAVVGCEASNSVYPAEDGTGGNIEARWIEDGSGQSDTWALGIGYADGPLSLSVGHMTHERENGDERSATMVSAGYNLAPGVSWKTSIFGVTDDTSGKEGNAFVTGLDIDF